MGPAKREKPTNEETKSKQKLAILKPLCNVVSYSGWVGGKDTRVTRTRMHSLLGLTGILVGKRWKSNKRTFITASNGKL